MTCAWLFGTFATYLDSKKTSVKPGFSEDEQDCTLVVNVFPCNHLLPQYSECVCQYVDNKLKVAAGQDISFTQRVPKVFSAYASVSDG